MKSLRLLPIVLLGILAMPGQTQTAPPPSMPALALLQPGQWELKSRDMPGENRSVCVTDPRALLQVRHGAAMCSRFVISSNPRDATVHYTCPGTGHGRTTIRVETARLVQIESQGIAGREPFNIRFEGRRTGECRVADRHSMR